jgi:hypothetical protein
VAGATIRVEGARELRAALAKAGVEASDLKDVNQQAGEIVATEAKAIGPRQSGTLVGTIRASRAKASAIVRAGGGAASAYAGVIHFGWAGHNIAPNPFLYDALDHRRDEVIKAYEAGVNKITPKI